MRWFRRRRGRETYAPNAPHPYQDGRDSFLAAFASGGAGSRGQAITPIATTSAFERTAFCAVPGCGKPAGDPIHAPDEA